MKENVQCSTQVISDALAQGSFNVVNTIFDKFREVINNGGSAYIYDEYLEPFNYRKELVFSNIKDLENWIEKHYPSL